MAREYKDSGIEWIGQIPKEWDSIRLKYLCTIQTGNKDTQDATPDGIYPFYVRSPKVEKSEAYSFDGEGILMAGDGVGAGRVFHHVFGKYAVHQRVYRLANITGINSSFLFYYISNLFGKEMDRGSAQSTVPSVRLPMLQNFIISAPSTSEQQKIANYLDKVCGEVDEMIALQEQMIEELKAYKQSVITETVTKGLNPNVPMKDSGIDWIGEVPKHWGIIKMNHLCSIITDFVASGSFESLRVNVPYLDTPDYAMLVRTADLSGSARSSGKVYISEHSYNFLNNSNLFGGEIVLPNIGASVGDVYIVPKLYERMSLAPNAIMFKTMMCDKYYYYYFCSKIGKESIYNISQSTAQAKFNKTELREIRVPTPSLEEQQSIASYLDTKCAEIDALIAIKQAKIDELKDYKKSVIYEYVTGKKEVV